MDWLLESLEVLMDDIEDPSYEVEYSVSSSPSNLFSF